MKLCVHIVALSMLALTVTSHAADSLHARIAAFDWSSVDPVAPVGAAAGGQPERKIDFTGLKQDTGYFLAYQVATIAVLYVMPEGISGWSEESKEEYSFERWKDNVSHPRWDQDDYFINYLLHPYWGATYYVRARHRGLKRASAFWYATLLSTLYEYGAEALFEQPSVQDLVVTPIGALLVGEYFFNTHNRIEARRAAGVRLTLRKRLALILTDPLDAANTKVRQVFGRAARLSARPVAWRSAGHAQWQQTTANTHPLDLEAGSPVLGLEIRLTF